MLGIRCLAPPPPPPSAPTPSAKWYCRKQEVSDVSQDHFSRLGQICHLKEVEAQFFFFLPPVVTLAVGTRCSPAWMQKPLFFHAEVRSQVIRYSEYTTSGKEKSSTSNRLPGIRISKLQTRTRQNQIRETKGCLIQYLTKPAYKK